jgi:NAD(P)-dependent dehydrogenase (short-subunit alcohol dehydrogenase family)
VVNDLGGPRDGSGADVSMAQKVVNAIKEEGGRAVANGSDISTMAGGQSVFEDAIKNFGRADILVNNAGILLDETFAKAKEANWDRVIRVHLKGTFCCTQPVFKWMRENGGGVIVNTSSTSGLIGNFGQTNYGAAKGGIWGLSNVLAIEGRKYNIRIWTLAPGALTRMTADLPRYKENPGAALGPDGIAPAVLYMVSDLSGDQTGKVLGVSGPRGVREMRMMEMEGWTPPFTGWKAEDIVTHAKEIFFSEEEIKKVGATIQVNVVPGRCDSIEPGTSRFRVRFAPRNDERDQMTKLTAQAAGTFAIAPTPFHDDGRIDEKSIDRLTDFYAEVGCDGVTVLGILGEAPKLDAAEAEQVAVRFVKRAKNMQIIVGVSAPGFASMRSLAKASMDAGAAGVMIAPPPHLRTDDQITGYFKQAQEAIGDEIPWVLQDYPLTLNVVFTPP